MALSQRLDLRQTQALVMTPQLQQAIKLLQLSNLELSLYVEGEVEQNPLPGREGGPPPSPAAEKLRPVADLGPGLVGGGGPEETPLLEREEGEREGPEPEP